MRNEKELSFALYQNEPNPFSDYTMIGFDLPKSMTATLSLYDVTGRTLKVISGKYEVGHNKVKLSREEIGVTGKIYYKLQADEMTAAKHMILVK